MRKHVEKQIDDIKLELKIIKKLTDRDKLGIEEKRYFLNKDLGTLKDILSIINEADKNRSKKFKKKK